MVARSSPYKRTQRRLTSVTGSGFLTLFSGNRRAAPPDNTDVMTQIAPTFQQAKQVREQGSDKVPRGEGGPEGTRAAVFTRKPTAPIYGGSDQERGGGDHQHQDAVQFLRDANTGQLRAVARGVVRSERMRMFPSGSPLRLIGPSAQAADFERETRVDLNRKDYLATPFHPTAKFSSLSGARITFSDDDQPFNAAVPFDARRTTLPFDEHRQMQVGMIDARLNRGPVTWGIRHGPIRV